jgi:acyl carrier protein
VPIHKRLITFFKRQELGYVQTLRPDESLIKSGIVNSLALFNMAIWIEQEIGSPIEFADINLPDDWDTIERIVAFIENCSGSVATPAKR